MNKSLAFVFAHLGLQKIGAIAVPLNPGFKPSEMAYPLDDADPKQIDAPNWLAQLVTHIPNKGESAGGIKRKPPPRANVVHPPLEEPAD